MTMVPKHRIPTHPGEVLREEFLKPLKMTQMRFAKHIGVSFQRVNEIVRGRRGITPETAWLFADALGTTPQFWMNLQIQHDLVKHRPSVHLRRLRTA
jgi:antitoxin HigA-1